MTINLTVPNLAELKPHITVFGVGGAGGNAVNNMIESRLEGVEFVVANTDAQALTQNAAERRIQMGTALTQGLGAGSQPQVGAAAGEEALPEIMDHLAGGRMGFIKAGGGGGCRRRGSAARNHGSPGGSAYGVHHGGNGGWYGHGCRACHRTRLQGT